MYHFSLFLCRTGLVESKVRILTGKLEYNEGIELAHVNCKTFTPDPAGLVVCVRFI